MKLPFRILTGLNENTCKRWEKQFVNTNRSVFESIWRRTQDEANSKKSGWKSPKDKRRRMLHYHDQYNIIKDETGYSFALIAPYLWMSLAFPKEEISGYYKAIKDGTTMGGWEQISSSVISNIFKKGDLQLCIKKISKYPEDIEASRTFGNNYEIIDITLSSENTTVTEATKKKPWDVLKTGLRKTDKRGSPTIIANVADLKKYFPAQIELGCGPSIEAGVPPLHYLHDIYSISEPNTGNFILDYKKDKLFQRLLGNPELFFSRASLPYTKALMSEPTDFFYLLRDLKEDGKLVGPIITDNFDGYPALLGLEEYYVRKYDESHIIPNIKFDKKAKSLIVFGSHADRRKIQQSARKQGVKVIYVDPEGYIEGRNFRPYPLESIQDEDILLNMTAAEFSKSLSSL